MTGTGQFGFVCWICTAIVIGWCVAILFASIFQCVPIAAGWDLSTHGKCIDQKSFFLGQAIPNAIMDFVLLIIPLPFLWKLHVRRPQKVALVVIFLLGYWYVVPSKSWPQSLMVI